ncbi:hypothetical protein HY382_00795 [Candidatus Curtissbacteria bacterium]|nr:hypothetical protein [Candidatus Curtissbacteria bacterium]
MRDLGKQEFRTSKPRKVPPALIKALLLIFVLIAVFYVAKDKLSFVAGSSSSVKLAEAPRGLTPVKVSIDGVSGEGVDLKPQKITLRRVKGDIALASATASRAFGGGIYVLDVSANISDPVGQQYAVWLVGANGPVLIDYLKGSKTSWSLGVRTSDKYSSYDDIWITLERVKDQKPEEHILEGSF